MKRHITNLLSLLLLLALMGSLHMTASAAEPYSPDGSVLFEKDGLKVTTAGLDVDPSTEEEETIIWLDIENAGEKEAYLGVSDGSVNGFMRDLYLIDYYMEDGECYGGDYEFQFTIPVGEKRLALGYNHSLLDLGPLSEMEFCFTLAQSEFVWPDYSSEPVVIRTDAEPKDIDLDELGTVVLDNDSIKLVLGEQDYDDFFGPQLVVYAENKTEDHIGLTADSADADGTACNFIYYAAGIAPGKRSAELMVFDSPISELKGFEKLTLGFSLRRAENRDDLNRAEITALEPVTAQFPPQAWGEYENGGLKLEIKPKYNELVTVETPENDENGMLFVVSETASMEAGEHEGAGWLFSIGKVDEARLHEMLCNDMSGANVFAKGEDGTYYMYYHPTDVRYERKTPEEMKRDQEQWTMLCQWAESVRYTLIEKNGLENVEYGNSDVEIYLARAAWMPEANATISATGHDPVDVKAVDGTPFAEQVMQGWFMMSDTGKAPDGDYVELSFPDEKVRLDFFSAPGGFVRFVTEDTETLYQAGWFNDEHSYAQIMRDWYDAAAAHA